MSARPTFMRHPVARAALASLTLLHAGAWAQQALPESL